jgi:hypothetical protein
MRLHLFVCGLMLATSSALAQAPEIIFDQTLYKCSDCKPPYKPGEVYLVHDAALTGTTITNVHILITRGFAGLPHLRVDLDYYNHNWSFSKEQGEFAPITARNLGTFFSTVLYFTLLDENNKVVTMEFEPTSSNIRTGPPPNHTFHTPVERSHCSRKPDEKHAAYAADLRNLSAKPVSVKLDDNHFLGPNIGPC